MTLGEFGNKLAEKINILMKIHNVYKGTHRN
jgi:hypothetical protein